MEFLENFSFGFTYLIITFFFLFLKFSYIFLRKIALLKNTRGKSHRHFPNNDIFWMDDTQDFMVENNIPTIFAVVSFDQKIVDRNSLDNKLKLINHETSRGKPSKYGFIIVHLRNFGNNEQLYVRPP